MVHFTQFFPAGLYIQPLQCIPCGMRVTPFGDPGVRRMCAPNPGFSQLAASFFVLQLQGIRHRPVFAWPYCHLQKITLLFSAWPYGFHMTARNASLGFFLYFFIFTF